MLRQRRRDAAAISPAMPVSVETGCDERDDASGAGIVEMLSLSGDTPTPELPIEDERPLIPMLSHLGDGVIGEVPPSLNRFLASVLSWCLLPIYVTVGPTVRARTVRMVPAAGPNRGHFPGAGAPIRMLVVGDSSAAAVGVANTRDGLASRIAEGVAESSGRPVSWVAHGHNSAVASDLRDHIVPHLPDEPFTHIVISVGANDAKNFHSSGRWRHGFGTLLYALRTRYPDAKIVWSRLFHFSKLPAVPAPLGWFLDLRRCIFNRIADELCIERGAHAAPPMEITSSDGLSADGFHASALGYRMWGRHIADHITSLDPPPRRRSVPNVRPRIVTSEAEPARDADRDAGPLDAAPLGVAAE